MIRDSCACGATMEVKRNSIYSELETHDRWLEAHAVCRKPRPATHNPWRMASGIQPMVDPYKAARESGS
jgi:hypothetical protein